MPNPRLTGSERSIEQTNDVLHSPTSMGMALRSMPKNLWIQELNTLSMFPTIEIIPMGIQINTHGSKMLRIRGGMIAMPNNNAPGGNGPNGPYGNSRMDDVNLNKLPGMEKFDGIPVMGSNG